MNHEYYCVLWVVYCIAALILLYASCFFTGFLWRWLKESIVLVITVILFSPILIAPELNQYAPAIAVLAMDFVMHVGDHQVQLMNQLFYHITVVLAVYFAFAIFIRWPIEMLCRKLYNKWKNRGKSKEKDVSHYETDEQVAH